MCMRVRARVRGVCMRARACARVRACACLSALTILRTPSPSPAGRGKAHGPLEQSSTFAGPGLDRYALGSLAPSGLKSSPHISSQRRRFLERPRPSGFFSLFRSPVFLIILWPLFVLAPTSVIGWLQATPQLSERW